MEDVKKKPYSEMTIEGLKALAMKGDAKAQYNLAECYALGIGKNPPQEYMALQRECYKMD